VSDVHLPDLGAHSRGKSLLKIALEVVLISTGVFLGLMGEQWREHRQHRELAESSLRTFRTELASNRTSVAAVKDYHVTTSKALERYLAVDPRARERDDLSIQGLRPAFIEHTAWDLALATQALAYIDPKLAFALSKIYSLQQEYQTLTLGVLQSMYVHPPSKNDDAFFRAVSLYYGDVVLIEPRLLTMYDGAVTEIDRALGESAAP
jgi:hypothetical protein